MRTPRVFVDLPLNAQEEIVLPADAAHHVNRVLRLRGGDSLRVFNASGQEFAATLAAVERSRVAVHLVLAVDEDRESPLQSVLAQGVCRGERMDYCVQKAVELGVTRICPILARRSVVKLDSDRAMKRVTHWQSVAVSAAEQSGRRHIVAIDEPVTLDDFLDRSTALQLRLLDFDGASSNEWVYAPPAPLALLTGPEGGWSPEENAAARNAGAVTWGLGPRILRTETAGVAALAIAQSRWGDL